MADKSFDVVIVGGGNKALVTAMYLTKFGNLSVGMFEDRHELGGGWCCEEPVAGFIANTCSHQHFNYYYSPLRLDFPEWEQLGGRVKHGKIGAGAVFIEDDTCVPIYNRTVDPNQEMTAREIARFSQRDADTWLALWGKFTKYWEPAIMEYFFNPAQPIGVEDAMDRLVKNPDAGIDPYWAMLSPYACYRDVFESPKLWNTFTRVMQSVGFPPDMDGLGCLSLLALIFAWPQACHVIGGSHQLAHASQRVMLNNGGTVFTKHPVEKILIENGKAKGIRLADGTEIEARKAVLSNVDPYQLCFDLIGEEHIPAQIANRVKNLSRHWICISWYTWALKEKPQYKAESFNPEIGDTEWLALADDDMQSFLFEGHERMSGHWPHKTDMIASYHPCTEDACLSPEGRYVALTEQYVLPADAMTDEQWKIKEKEHAQELIGNWEKYAPNMNWDNVIGYAPVTPNYTAHQCKNYGPAGNWCVIDFTLAQLGRFRPIPELAGHRTPIDGLYATGTAWHPFGYAGCSQGYTAYKVMADDLGLGKPWEQEGRPW